MSTTTSHESRQARRWRMRQETKRPAPSPRKPYVLLCRCEDAQGWGFWTVTEVDDPQDGDALARHLQAAPGGILGETLRCELVANTPDALRSWGATSVQHRTAAHRLGEELPWLIALSGLVVVPQRHRHLNPAPAPTTADG